MDPGLVAVTAAATARRTTRVEYKRIVAAVYLCGISLDILYMTMVNVALPDLGREFNATTASLQWIVLGYLLSLAVFIPTSGWIGDRFGTRRVCPLRSSDVHVGVCAVRTGPKRGPAGRVPRAARGRRRHAGFPVAAMLFRAFPPIERAKAATVLFAGASVVGALGPVLGGWLVTNVSWRWIFYVNLPVGLLGFAIGFLFLREEHEGHQREVATLPVSCCRAPDLPSPCCTRSRTVPEGARRRSSRRALSASSCSCC